MPTILITGAGRGLGLEYAKQFAAEGWRVIGTVRDAAKGASLAKLGKSVEVHLLDVADRKAIARLAADLKGTAIDVLICNSGVYGPKDQPFGKTDYAAWEEVMRINVLAPMAVVEAFVPHVAASERKTIVMMSSRMGSITENNGGAPIYRTSKTALNQVMKYLSVELAAKGITVVSVHPGWVQTDMGGPSAPLTPQVSIAGLRGVIKRLKPADSGKFINYEGAQIAW
ncbi:MAG: SDR family oxidoreductase [Proteobacteria bacterium]|nr:SDR family oxidoreductase [Pseudomonadota bacterium]